MLKNVYFARYGKILLALCLLIVGLFAFNGWNSVHNWHTNRNYQLEDKELAENFKNYPENYTYWDEELQKDIPYDSLADYIDNYSYVFHKGNHSPLEQKNAKADPNISYFSSLNNSAMLFATALAALVGFALFFIDLKTNFTRFSFSLPASRKELFGKKLLYIALPFLAAILIGQLLYLAILRLGIPQPYLNATLGEMFTSLLNSFAIVVVVFSLSVFIGSMVGNIFFGPLTWLVFLALLGSFKNAVNMLLSTFNMSKPELISNFHAETLFNLEIGKTTGHWYMSVICLIISILVLFWAYQKFQVISLEHDGDYLLTPESRWPIWFLMTTFTSFVLLFGFVSPWTGYVGALGTEYEYSIIAPITSTLIVIATCGGISFILVFFSSLKRFFRLRKAQKLARN